MDHGPVVRTLLERRQGNFDANTQIMDEGRKALGEMRRAPL